MTDFMQRIGPPKVNPLTIPEHDLWQLAKDGKRLTLRWREVPFGQQTRAELRFYRDDRFLKSYVIVNGRPLLEVAEEERQERLADGWTDSPVVAM